MKQLSNPQKENAAQLLAEGRLSFSEISEKVGVDRKTLQRWRQEPRFADRVKTVSLEFSEAAKARAIRRKEYRVDILADMQSRIRTVIEERAADPSMSDVPGGKSGLLVRQFKVSGETVVTEYAVDTGTIRELRAIQEQAAKELGQLVEKHDHRVIRDVSDLTDEELNAIAGTDSRTSEGSGSEGDRAQEEGEGSGAGAAA